MKAHANQKEKPVPVSAGLENRASEPAGGLIGILMAAAKRQEELIEALIRAVESGNQRSINEAARAITAHRRTTDPADILRT